MSERKEKFTPGPWEIKDGFIIHKRTECGYMFEEVIHGMPFGVQREEDAADAALIATAPEMYHELERLLSIIGEEDYEIVNKILQKARGEA